MAMTRKIWAAIAWIVFAIVVFATLSPIGLRPHLTGAHREHFAAFGAIGFLFGMAYPRKPVIILMLVLGAAAALESLQLLTPDRHAAVTDVGFKLVGGAAGVFCAWLFARRKALP